MKTQNVVIFNSDEESEKAFKIIEKLTIDKSITRVLNDYALEALFMDIEKVERFDRSLMQTYQFRLSSSVHAKLKIKSKELNIPIEKLILKAVLKWNENREML